MRRIWHGPREVEALAAAMASHPATIHQQVSAEPLADVVDLAEWKARKGEK